MAVRFGERADQHRLYKTGGVVSVGSESDFGVAPVWQDTAPINPPPFDGMLWVDTSSRPSSPVDGQPPYELKRYNQALNAWELVGYNVMPPAGPNHATGLVGDPGPTPHDPPWYWGDDSAFHPPTGGGGGGGTTIEFGVGSNGGGVVIGNTTYPSLVGSLSSTNLFGTMIPMSVLAPSGEQAYYSSAFHSDLLPTGMPGNVGTDVVLLTGGAYKGALVPLVQGWYYITGSVRFPVHNDSNYRAAMIATIGVAGLTGYNTFINLTTGVAIFRFTITNAGHGYADGDVVTWTGGGGSSLTGKVQTDGSGHIVSIPTTDVGFGYTGSPTGLSITSAGGSGFTLSGLGLATRPGFDRIIAEETTAGIANAPVQVTVNKLWFLREYEVIYLMAAQGSGVSMTTSGPGTTTYSMNEYFHTLSLFRIDETPLGPSWTPGLPE